MLISWGILKSCGMTLHHQF